MGRHVVLAARAAGMDVTLFTRGRTNPELFADVERLTGDRDGDLSALHGRRWDAVVDTSGYVPRVVDRTLDAIAAATGHYTFVSSVSVYADPSAATLSEESPLAAVPEGTEAVTGDTYGGLKAGCERAVTARLGDRALVVRPGLVAGPHDPTGRFSYWPRRLARGGEVLAPGDPGAPVQFIDARDLGDWVVRMAAAGATGTYNGVGPAGRLTLGQLLATCAAVADADATLTWVDAAFLAGQGVVPWTDLPLWLPDDRRGMTSVDASSARAAGLTYRSVEDTARATLRWDAGQPLRADAPGLDPQRERDVLAAWHAADGASR